MQNRTRYKLVRSVDSCKFDKVKEKWLARFLQVNTSWGTSNQLYYAFGEKERGKYILFTSGALKQCLVLENLWYKWKVTWDLNKINSNSHFKPWNNPLRKFKTSQWRLSSFLLFKTFKKQTLFFWNSFKFRTIEQIVQRVPIYHPPVFSFINILH